MKNMKFSTSMESTSKVCFLLPKVAGDKMEFHSGIHIYPALETMLRCSGFDVQASSRNSNQKIAYIGVLYLSANNEHVTFAEDAIVLTEKGCCGLLIVRSDDEQIKNKKPFVESPLLCAYKDSVEICASGLFDFFMAAKKIRANASGWDRTIELRHEKLRRVVSCYAVYDPIGQHFGHSTKYDLANCLLAPLRLVAKFEQNHNTEAKTGNFAFELQKLFGANGSDNRCWESFKSRLDTIGTDSGIRPKEICLNLEFQEIVSRLDTQRKVDFDPDPESIAENAEALMLLLTECRRNAGVVTDAEAKTLFKDSSKRATEKSVSLQVVQANIESDAKQNKAETAAHTASHPSTQNDHYRLLVVDDHCEFWKLLFDNTKFKNQLEGRLKRPVDICYSQDGLVTSSNDATQAIFPEKVSIVSAAFQCDAVLLDILIDGVSGLDVLAKIREYSNSIPVILWTTTRSQEITNQAQQANGVILKKTCDSKSFIETVANWLEVGKNRRGASLLNPFFDSVIKRPEYRDYARNVTEWALKWMDGFHATSDYFRIFTDHGGRHYIKILEHLERAIQPFLGGETLVDERYFSCDKDVREQEFLVLYLAVFLHEVGMFPIDKEKDDRRYMGFAYADCMRELHAPRGMLLLEDDRGEDENLWADKEGWNKICSPKGAELIRKKLAVLVGYHARFYASLKTVALLDGVVSSKRRQEKLVEAFKLCMFGTQKPQVLFEQCSSRLKSYFEQQAHLERECELKNTNSGGGVSVSNCVGVKDRIRNMAALLRLCDAIDKDESRNPAEYLSTTGLFVTAEACNHNIEATAAHNKETLKAWVCKYVKVVNGRVNMEVKACCPDIELINAILDVFPVKEGARMSSVDELADLWKVEYQKTEPALKVSVLRLNDSLQAWLDCVWKIMAGEDSRGFTCRVHEMLDSHGCKTESQFTRKGIEALMRVSALAAGTEVVDEYTALVETELNDKLRLGEFVWEKSFDREKDSLKQLLEKISQVPDMLAKVLNGG